MSSDEGWASIITICMRVVGGLFVLGGLAGLAAAIFEFEFFSLRVVICLFLVLVGLATFLVKPVSAETIREGRRLH